MKLPRDISGAELAALLKVFGYEVTRQTGSHMRLTTHETVEYHLTILRHKPLRLGTLSSIHSEVAGHHQITRDEVERELFA